FRALRPAASGDASAGRDQPRRPPGLAAKALGGPLVDEHALALVESHADLARTRDALHHAGAEHRVRDAIAGAIAVVHVVRSHRPREIALDDLRDRLGPHARLRTRLRLDAPRAGFPGGQEAGVPGEHGAVFAVAPARTAVEAQREVSHHDAD